MELNICGRMQEPLKVKHSQLDKLYPIGKNLLIFGKSGEGKTQSLIDYAKKVGKKLLIISLAMEMPETIGGIPYSTEKGFFMRLLDERLAPVIECEGEGWIIFFDEVNQGTPEVFNALYSICHPDPVQRQWNGHSLAKVQVVAAGNLNDGTDGTVYLNDLPVPLLNRFFICQLVSDKDETLKYLKDKYKNIPQVAKYIDVLLKENIPPRDIEECLKIIAYEQDGLLLQMKIGSALTAKLYDIQKRVKSVDPAKIFTGCKDGYKSFKDNGYVQWGPERITDEDELLDRFREVLTEEEVKSIVKGVE